MNGLLGNYRVIIKPVFSVNFGSEEAGNVISGVVVDQANTDVRVKFWDSRSNRS